MLENLFFSAYGYFNFLKSKSDNIEILPRKLACLVTGGTSGIGKEAALQLATKGCTVYIVGRNKQKGDETVKEIATKSGNNNVSLLIADLNNVKSVLNLVKSLKGITLDSVILNAGVLLNTLEMSESKSGLESTFMTNFFSSFMIISEMMDTWKRRSGEPMRIILVSSGGMYTSGLQTVSHSLVKNIERGKYDGVAEYASSKRQIVEYCNWLASKYDAAKVRFYSMHPGWVDTPGVSSSLPKFYSMLKSSLRSVSEGADTMVWAALSKDALSFRSGAFLFDRRETFQNLVLSNTKPTEEEVEMFIQESKDLLAAEKARQ